ncbi:MAG: hypothetical protein P1U81_12145 [Verrucomicrobiales bacterium]|nr:hypothetical protein [bacterium]MDF2376988.1 hypothetical protein [Verrucomicrobiales bacterium]
MSELFIILGVLAFSFGLRSFKIKFLRKLGAVGILAATFLAFYLPTQSIIAGFGGLLMWFLLPWVELLTRIRQLRLPVDKTLEKATPPNTSKFPDFLELTSEVEDAGFEYVSDNGWEWDGMNQFYRIFYHPGKRQQAAICFTEQDGIAWACLTLTSRREDKFTYRTTNLPFSNPMKAAPDVLLRQSPECETFQELLDVHDQWIDDLALETTDFVEEDPETLTQLIEKETGRQIKYNLESGLIRLAEKAGTFRYSWRGLFYLYFQLVKDMVKMC